MVSLWDENRSDWLLGTTVRAPSAPRHYELDGVRVQRLGLPRSERARLAPATLAYYPAMGWATPRLVAPFRSRLRPLVDQADVVHSVRIGRESLSLASADAARAAGKPFVFTPLHHPRWVGRRYRNYLDLYRRADAVLALTEAEKRALVALGVRSEAVTVTGVGPILAPRAAPEEFRRQHGISGPVVLFLGQHHRYKGFHALLDATPQVWTRFPEATFVFAGPSAARSERVFRARKDPRILRLGSVDLQTKTDALAACTALCVPSTQESFGGVFTEAWELGKPVVGCDIPAVRDVIDDGEDGLLVSQDPAAIAERLIYLLDHPGLADRMGEAGRAKVADRCSWPKLAEKTSAVYRSLL